MKDGKASRCQELRRAFTLIELMVTLSILLVMLGLINFIFRDTQRAVSLGIETGETISAQRGVASQIRQDFIEMVGPHQGDLPDSDAGGGFLVITQQMVTDRNFNGLPDLSTRREPDPTDPSDEGLLIALPTNNSGANAGQSFEKRLVRSDQVGFIRNRGGDQPIAPILESEFTSRRVPVANRKIDYIRVSYGHLFRTNEDGTAPSNNPPSQPFASLFGEAGSGNENPLDWLLGRSAVFLDGTLAVPTGSLTPAGIYADDISPDGVVNGISGLPGSVSAILRNGLTDFAFFGFEHDEAIDHTNGSLVGSGGITSPNNVLLESLPSQEPSFGESDYELRAIDQATSTFGRLRANPTPPYVSLTNGYETWQVAQSHPILAEGCSDFVIDFAADIYGGGGGPNTARFPLMGTDIFAPDGQIDRDADGAIAWYATTLGAYVDAGTIPVFGGARTYPVPATYHPSVDFSMIAGLPTPRATGAFVWRHDRYDAGIYDITNDEWERSRSPLTPRLGIAPSTAEIDASRELNPTNVEDEFCDWPYLIRVRYRLHDPKGQIASGQQIHIDSDSDGEIDPDEFVDSRNGLWFEQILPVNRPMPTRIAP